MSPANDFAPPRIVKFQFPLKNGAYGFPRLQTRRMKPFVLICIHITGNHNTAKMPIGIGKGTGTRAEVAFMARDRHFGTDRAQPGNSAHDYIARDGSVLSCIPTKFAAWNNGDVHRPNTRLDSVTKVVALRSQGRNVNEAYLREVECTGNPGKFKLTPEQRETLSFLIARDSLRGGISISRDTVHLHSDIDGVNRRHCPFGPSQSLGTIEDQVSAVIKRAKQIKAQLQDPDPDDEHLPDPVDEPTELEQLQAELDAAEGDLARLRREQRHLVKVIELLSAIAATPEGATQIIDDDTLDDDGDDTDDPHDDPDDDADA